MTTKLVLNKVHLMLTFKLLLFIRLILTLGSGVGFPHWSHNWIIMGLRNSLPLITATGWKRYKCTILFNSTYLGHSWQFRNPQNNSVHLFHTICLPQQLDHDWIVCRNVFLEFILSCYNKMHYLNYMAWVTHVDVTTKRKDMILKGLIHIFVV